MQIYYYYFTLDETFLKYKHHAITYNITSTKKEKAENNAHEIDQYNPVQPDTKPACTGKEGEPGWRVNVLKPVKLSTEQKTVAYIYVEKRAQHLF